MRNPPVYQEFLAGISRIRRNHAWEHAVLHILGWRFPHRTLAGYSDAGGFWILGEVPGKALAEAVGEALYRLRNGEAGLAIHPNCGTNALAGGVLTTLAVWLVLRPAGGKFREQVKRLPDAAAMAALATAASKPLGTLFQVRLTTDGSLRGLDVSSIKAGIFAGISWHRVTTIDIDEGESKYGRL
jgi:hypothetical protein